MIFHVTNLYKSRAGSVIINEGVTPSVRNDLDAAARSSNKIYFLVVTMEFMKPHADFCEDSALILYF